MPMGGSPRQPAAGHAAPLHDCEALVAEGLETVAGDELEQLAARSDGPRLAGRPRPGRGAVRFTAAGDLRPLLGLQTVQAVYLVGRFAVPRPRALLGDEHFRVLLGLVAAARRLHPPAAFASLYISAAGADSAVLTRLRDELAARTGLEPAGEQGDLQLRLRRAGDSPGWEALVRLSPRPLAARGWRVCNREGALNAGVAHAMIRLTRPRARDIFLNLACGSGTLLIERLAGAPAARALGCDHDPAALACAAANVAASGHTGIELLPWDATALPLPDAGVDAVVADLPFGNLVGSHAGNLVLYPRLLAEAARVARPGARAAFITHEVRLMESLLAAAAEWQVAAVLPITLGGLHPRIYLLRRTAGPIR